MYQALAYVFSGYMLVFKKILISLIYILIFGYPIIYLNDIELVEITYVKEVPFCMGIPIRGSTVNYVKYKLN